MPSLLPLVAVAAMATPAEPPCTIAYDAPDDLTQVVQRDGFSFDGFDRLCGRLQRDDLKVLVTSMNGVLLDRAYGGVSVTLVRDATGVAGTITQQSMVMDRVADSPTARRAAMSALNNALRDIAADPEPYIRSVAANEVRLRRKLSQPAR